MIPGRFRVATIALSVSGLLFAQDDRAALARRLMAGGDAVRAIPEFVQAVEAAPSNAQLWTELGEARLAAGQIKPSISDLGRAVKLDPSSVRAQKSLANAVEASGNAQRALIEWRRLSQIADGPEHDLADSHVNSLLEKLGMALPAEGSTHPKAQVATPAPAGVKPAPAKPSPSPKEAAKAAPKTSTPDLQKALDAWKAGKRDEALETIRTIVRAHPTPDAWYWGGVMRVEEKAWDKADFNLKKAVDDPKLAGRAWYWLGRSAEGQGKANAAKDAFRKSLQKDPSGEFAADVKARLEPSATASAAKPEAATVDAAPVAHESTPPLLPDSLRDLWTWNPPDVAIPPLDASPAGKLWADAARQLKSGQNDLALSSIESLKMKYPGTPAADAASLATAVADLAMGLHPLAVTNAQAFLRDHPDHARAPLARFVAAIALLRLGRADTATTILSSFQPKPDDGWTPAEHQSAIAQGLRLQKRYADAADALRLAFQAEKDVRRKRSLALRAVRDNQSAGTPVQALPLVVDARKGCDKGGACMHLAVAEADLDMAAKEPAKALVVYNQVARDWPNGPETPWARYQIGTAQLRLGKAGEAASSWKELIEKNPGSYWASQAKLRMEDALWRDKYKETLH